MCRKYASESPKLTFRCMKYVEEIPPTFLLGCLNTTSRYVRAEEQLLTRTSAPLPRLAQLKRSVAMVALGTAIRTVSDLTHPVEAR